MSKSHVSRVRELYKLILRLHRSLPDDLKILGDNYAREEFKRHKKCKLQEAQIFLNEWREYAVSMSRQAAPGRAQKRPADEQAGPSREVRAADLRQAAPGVAEVRAADLRQAAPRAAEVRAADLRQAAPRAAEVRAAYYRQAAARNREVAAAIAREDAAARARPRFGRDLNEERISQMTPDQLLNFYRLLINARGENPHPEYANEPIDIGIELIATDVYSKCTEEAKKQIVKIEKEDTEKLIRGEIYALSFLSKKDYWFKRFERAQAIKDTEELRLAIDSLRITESEAETARISAKNAEKESEKAKKIANEARATAENAKQAAYVDTKVKDPKLHEAFIIAEVNALKEAKKAKELTEKALKLAIIAKSKGEELDAALDFTKEIWKDLKGDLLSFDDSNP